MALNKLTLNLEGNDELKEHLAKKAPGDDVEFTLVAKIDEVTPDQAVFSVTDATAISDDSLEADETEDELGKLETPEEEETPAVMMAFGKSDEADQEDE